ncbi:gag-pol polyprotein [Gossypium australe]|uniref:Gag-pol polyprotein n=1 Tax=Gossypium australe TaxID=47621 RepID=A0A5B6VNI6_9ROSI|nr:gag-pol polyprotein [Gossypium australe]
MNIQLRPIRANIHHLSNMVLHRVWTWIQPIFTMFQFIRSRLGLGVWAQISYLVDSLQLPCSEHLKPYHFQWLNECFEVRVTKQSLITFKLGNYEDEVWSWQFDHDVMHYGKQNGYSLIFRGEKNTYWPL